MPDDADLAFAQQVVVEYARTLECDLIEQNLPARVDSLPIAKAAILNAIETSVTFLSSTSALTDDHIVGWCYNDGRVLRWVLKQARHGFQGIRGNLE